MDQIKAFWQNFSKTVVEKKLVDVEGRNNYFCARGGTLSTQLYAKNILAYKIMRKCNKNFIQT